MRIELTFKGAVPTMNGKHGLIRMHWRKKKQLLLNYQIEAMSQTTHRFAGPVTLELIRYRSKGVDTDLDNLSSSAKLLQDAIVKAHILPNDSKVVIGKLTCREERCEIREQRTVIILEDAEPRQDTPAPQ